MKSVVHYLTATCCGTSQEIHEIAYTWPGDPPRGQRSSELLRPPGQGGDGSGLPGRVEFGHSARSGCLVNISFTWKNMEQLRHGFVDVLHGTDLLVVFTTDLPGWSGENPTRFAAPLRQRVS